MTFQKAEGMWNGEIQADPLPSKPINRLAPLSENIWFFNGLSNMAMVETSDGLIIVDPGAVASTVDSDGYAAPDCVHKYQAVRQITQARAHTIIYTHGHMDHIYGGDQYTREAAAQAWPYPQIVAHEAIIPRLDRYRSMAPQIERINRRQFASAGDVIISSPDYAMPNLLYRDSLQLNIGGMPMVVRHGRGETDDHSWVYFPSTRLLCTGDFFIWSMPNAGNPQKVQRYALEWARELRAMATLRPRILIPGHGLIILGEERVITALDDTATLLESLHSQTIDLINQGLTLEEVVSSVHAPEYLLNKPYLKPSYDETEFIVRNIWRLYGGWHDGIPSHLKPATQKEQAQEIVQLAGGVTKLVKRAQALFEAGELRLATHVAEWAYFAAPDDPAVRRLAQQTYSGRAESETSIMARGVFRSAASDIGQADQRGPLTGHISNLSDALALVIERKMAFSVRSTQI